MRDWLKENLRDLQNYSINLFRALPPNQVRMLIYGQGRTGVSARQTHLAALAFEYDDGVHLNLIGHLLWRYQAR